MSKILDATCSAAGVVTADGVEVEATILSEATKASEGVLFIEETKATYITSNASDIKSLITSLVTIVDQIVTITTSLNAVTVPPGGATAAIATLTSLKTSLNATKDTLK